MKRCTVCQVPHDTARAIGELGDEGTYMLFDGQTFTFAGAYVGMRRGSEYESKGAHVAKVSAAGLCQRCRPKRPRSAPKAQGRLW